SADFSSGDPVVDEYSQDHKNCHDRQEQEEQHASNVCRARRNVREAEQRRNQRDHKEDQCPLQETHYIPPARRLVVEIPKGGSAKLMPDWCGTRELPLLLAAWRDREHFGPTRPQVAASHYFFGASSDPKLTRTSRVSPARTMAALARAIRSRSIEG